MMNCPYDGEECSGEGCVRGFWIVLDDWEGCALDIAEMSFAELLALLKKGAQVADSLASLLPDDVKRNLIGKAAGFLLKLKG